MPGFGGLPTKTKFRRSSGTCQIVTGLVVNDKLRPTTQFIQSLRAIYTDFAATTTPSCWPMNEASHACTRIETAYEGRVRHLRRFDPPL